MIYKKYKYIKKYYNFNIKLNYDFKNMKKPKKCYTCYGKCYCDCTLKTIVSSDGPQSPPWKGLYSSIPFQVWIDYSFKG